MEYINAIIGRDLEAVERVLGPAEKKEYIKLSDTEVLKAYFSKEGIDIVFISNIADWITVHNINHRTTLDIISFFGLVKLKPSFNFRDTVSYSNLGGLKQVTFQSNRRGEIGYVSIKAFSKEIH